jgi:hypothetical protein
MNIIHHQEPEAIVFRGTVRARHSDGYLLWLVIQRKKIDAVFKNRTAQNHQQEHEFSNAQKSKYYRTNPE